MRTAKPHVERMAEVVNHLLYRHNRRLNSLAELYQIGDDGKATAMQGMAHDSVNAAQAWFLRLSALVGNEAAYSLLADLDHRPTIVDRLRRRRYVRLFGGDV